MNGREQKIKVNKEGTGKKRREEKTRQEKEERKGEKRKRLGKENEERKH